MQQVFIRKAYNVLRNHVHLKDNSDFTTQLVISTHSNHVAHEIDFTALRYFKRDLPGTGKIATATVVNLSTTFGNESETTKFAIRYLKTTHCDLFFADAVIMVEGPAEKILVPYFISKHSKLCICYLSILEIGGSHAHTLRPLIENLGIITLVVTDIDAADPKARNSGVQPEPGKGYVTNNNTLKKWLPAEKDLDTLLKLPFQRKEHDTLPVRVAYQTALTVGDGDAAAEVFPYTFEDCIVAENKDLFAALKKPSGLLAKMKQAAEEKDSKTFAKNAYEGITATGVKKAEFALELLYIEVLEKLKTPAYIQEGFDWLEQKLALVKPNMVKAEIVVA